ncbi:MAG TPA: hypothetical protein VFC39_07835 [Acidobacteriaceae bacterium]|nr:hypothetical protein [Acidobacteriaceae bacterium]
MENQILQSVWKPKHKTSLIALTVTLANVVLPHIAILVNLPPDVAAGLHVVLQERVRHPRRRAPHAVDDGWIMRLPAKNLPVDPEQMAAH